MGDIWRGDHQSIIYRLQTLSINITIKLGSTAQSEASPALSVCLVLEYLLLLISIIIYHKHICIYMQIRYRGKPFLDTYLSKILRESVFPIIELTDKMRYSDTMLAAASSGQ